MSPGGWGAPIVMFLQGFESEKPTLARFRKTGGLLYEALVVSSRLSTLSWQEGPGLGRLGLGWELSDHRSLSPHLCSSLPAGFIPLFFLPSSSFRSSEPVATLSNCVHSPGSSAATWRPTGCVLPPLPLTNPNV